MGVIDETFPLICSLGLKRLREFMVFKGYIPGGRLFISLLLEVYLGVGGGFEATDSLV